MKSCIISSSCNPDSWSHEVQRMVEYHNWVRQSPHIQTGAISYDRYYQEQEAMFWATNLAQNHGCRLHNSPVNAENLFAKHDSTYASLVEAAAAWHSVHRVTRLGIDYNEYTAMIWKDVDEFGCAKSINYQLNCVVIVCRYGPKVNVIGEHPVRK